LLERQRDRIVQAQRSPSSISTEMAVAQDEATGKWGILIIRPGNARPLFWNARQARAFLAAADQNIRFSSIKGSEFLAALAQCAVTVEIKERLR
jgi:hypothetical protein